MNKNELIELVVDYAEKVFFYCVKRCNNRPDAEDLSQTILLEVIQNINKGIEIDNLDYYIWGVCKNQFNMYLRRTIKERSNVDLVEEVVEADNSNSVLYEMIQDEKITKINQAIKMLSKDYTEILYAYYVEDKTLKFISEELNLPLGTVKWKLSKIREKLKEYLDMEKLNGKKAYVPKNFAGIQSYDGTPDFNPHEVVQTLLIKNLLFHSYDNPCSLEDYSMELGISIEYIREYVVMLLNKQFLIKTSQGKYLTNIAFVDKVTKRNIFDLVKTNIMKLKDSILKFCQENVEYYRSLLNDSKIPNELAMWSLIFIVKCYLERDDVEYTKSWVNGHWDYCMVEQTNDQKYDEYFISYNGCNAKYGNLKTRFSAWPASCNNSNFKVAYRISYDQGATGFEKIELFDVILNKKEFKYSQIKDEVLKKDVDEYLELDYLSLEDDLVKINVPVIKESNLEKLYDLIQNDETLQNANKEYQKNISIEVGKFFPQYLQNQISFIVDSVTNTSRSIIINAAYQEGMLSLDDQHQNFVYNMIIVQADE